LNDWVAAPLAGMRHFFGIILAVGLLTLIALLLALVFGF
jgi:hypothetical protein